MDEPRQLPHMLCDGDMLSIYECAECGAVVRDPDTHVGWHASRPWSEPTVINNLMCDCGRNKPCRHCRNGSADRAETGADDIVITQNWSVGKGQTVDDIVTRLRHQMTLVSTSFPAHDAMEDAADEIERLRKLGDHLFMHADSHYGIGQPCPDWVKRDLDAWQEARRG